MTIQVYLNFPHEDWTVELPAVPRIGETLEWESPEGIGQWTITDITWTAYPDQPGAVGLALDPGNEETKQLMAEQEAAREARIAEARADRTTEQ
ncbi:MULTISPECIES: hypothetical protein [Streptomyces]|uniref:Uncharacterized protein n=1 Tax=Streptomyces mordarskii TaxID=1226758 RepID=A0ABP3NVJ9_9ACTN